MISEDKVNAVRCMDIAESTAGIDHILFGCIFIHEITGDHEYIGILRLDLCEMRGKSCTVEGGSDMGIRKQSNPEGTALFFGLKSVVRLPDVKPVSW